MKRKISVIFVLLIVFVFCGCNSEVNYTYVPGEDRAYLYLDFAMENTELDALNNSSMQNPDRRTYRNMLRKPGESVELDYVNVETYLDALIGLNENIAKEETAFNSDRTYTIYSYSWEQIYPSDEQEEEEAAVKRKDGFYFRTYSVEQDNPFNTFKSEYSGSAQSGGLIDIFKNGTYGFPSFKQVFPAFKDTDDLKLNFYFQSDYKLFMENKQTMIDENGRQYYLFKTSLLSGGAKIKYQYYRVNAIGWYVTSMAAGIIVVCAILLYCYFKKKKPAAQEDGGATSATYNKDYYEILYKDRQKSADPFGNEYNKSQDPFGGYDKPQDPFNNEYDKKQ